MCPMAVVKRTLFAETSRPVFLNSGSMLKSHLGSFKTKDAQAGAMWSREESRKTLSSPPPMGGNMKMTTMYRETIYKHNLKMTRNVFAQPKI